MRASEYMMRYHQMKVSLIGLAGEVTVRVSQYRNASMHDRTAWVDTYNSARNGLTAAEAAAVSAALKEQLKGRERGESRNIEIDKIKDLIARLDSGNTLLSDADQEILQLQRAAAARQTDHRARLDVWPALCSQINSNSTPVGTQQRQFRATGEILNLGQLRKAFTGKGTPEAVAQVLQLVEWFSRSDRSQATPNTQSFLQSYCNDYLGLDCSGFVMNYLEAAGLGRANTIDALFQQSARITRLEDIGADCCIIFKSSESGRSEHIAIVDSVEPISNFQRQRGRASTTVRARPCGVVESAGTSLSVGRPETDGLYLTRYLFLDPVDGRFPRDRGNEGTGNPVGSSVYDGPNNKSVYIVRPT